MKRRRGLSLVEVLMAATITVSALTTGVSLFIMGMMSWYRGEGRIVAEMKSHSAVRQVAMDLREAMGVTVDGGGMGLTYTMPATDGNGNFLIPLTSDGITHRIELDGTDLNMIDNGVVRNLCHNVITTDPLSSNGSSPYELFSAGGGSNTRSLTVMVVTQEKGYDAELVTGRNRETIYLRNVPQLNQ